MSKQMKWGIATLLLLLGIAAVFIFLDQNAELRQLEKETAESDKLRQEHNKRQEPPQVQPPPQKAHVHADGSRHEGQHHDPMETSPSPEFTPASIQIPEGITDPDVVAAWQRLDYISKHIWEWGARPSPHAAELIAELMPPPNVFEGENAHDDLEATIEVIDELAQLRDPRSVETLVTYMCEGIIAGTPMEEALVEIGPPSVPFLIPYLREDAVKQYLAVELLGRIGEQHWLELEGVVEHIIIPKLNKLLEPEAPDRILVGAHVLAQYVQEALVRLKK